MWRLATILNLSAAQLWFSDGMPIHAERGGVNSSSRLIVGGQGFLDITEICGNVRLDFNSHPLGSSHAGSLDAEAVCDTSVYLELRLPGHGLFTVTLPEQQLRYHGSVGGALKGLPVISAQDAAFIDDMVVQRIIPYRNITDAPGKSMQEIRALGRQFFPFSPHSFQLALCIYDWTTASFTRLVFMKIFEYTDLRGKPLDKSSIAEMIWASNFSSYTPQNPDYMNSFLMEPADSLDSVRHQLDAASAQLRRLSDVENRVLAAAFQGMPRTPVLAKPQLFSGQLDIFQLGEEHFGIEFLQCPLNAGPVGAELVTPFASALSTYAAPGRVITTKMVWATTDSFADALHYSNGIVLVINFPDDGAWVWDEANYITQLSDDAAKTEYDFAPGTSFLVQSVDTATVAVPTGVGNATTQETLTVITLQPHSKSKHRRAVYRSVAPFSAEDIAAKAASYPATFEKQVQRVDQDGEDVPSARRYRLAHKDAGRRCRCYDAIARLEASAKP